MKKLLLSILLAIYLLVSFELRFPHKGNLIFHPHFEYDIHLEILKREDVDKMIGNFDHVNGMAEK